MTRDLSGYERVEIPEGWNATVFFGRLVNAGACRIESLTAAPSRGGLTVRQVFDLHRMLDWRDYCEMTLAERRRRKSDH